MGGTSSRESQASTVFERGFEGFHLEYSMTQFKRLAGRVSSCEP